MRRRDIQAASVKANTNGANGQQSNFATFSFSSLSSLSLLSLSLSLSLSLRRCTFWRRISGWTSSMGEPLIFIRPLPFLQYDTAVAVFLRPNTCTDGTALACTHVARGRGKHCVATTAWHPQSNSVCRRARRRPGIRQRATHAHTHTLQPHGAPAAPQPPPGHHRGAAATAPGRTSSNCAPARRPCRPAAPAAPAATAAAHHGCRLKAGKCAACSARLGTGTGPGHKHIWSSFAILSRPCCVRTGTRGASALQAHGDIWRRGGMASAPDLPTGSYVGIRALGGARGKQTDLVRRSIFVAVFARCFPNPGFRGNNKVHTFVAKRLAWPPSLCQSRRRLPLPFFFGCTAAAAQLQCSRTLVRVCLQHASATSQASLRQVADLITVMGANGAAATVLHPCHTA